MAMTLITTNTSSGAATSAFTSSIDSTYKLYIFKFIDVNPATDNLSFTFGASTDGGSNYNLVVTTTMIVSYHDEAESSAALSYDDTHDATQTATPTLCGTLGNGADECCAGTLLLFDPSNTTYMKHFICTIHEYHAGNYAQTVHTGGYINSAADVDAIQFKMSDGNLDAVIKMYGVG